MAPPNDDRRETSPFVLAVAEVPGMIPAVSFPSLKMALSARRRPAAALVVALTMLLPSPVLASIATQRLAPTVDPAFEDDTAPADETDTPQPEPEPERPLMTSSGHEDDELVLAGGGLVRGRITEIIPGQSVAIMPTGRDQLREVAWAEIDEIRRAGEKPAPAEAEPTAAADPVQPGVLGGDPTEPEPEPYRGPYVHLDVSSDRDVGLYEVLAEGSGRVSGTFYRVDVSVERPVCWSPCNRRVDLSRSASYVVRGDRVAPSKPFTLASGDRLTLHVKARPKALRPAGWVVFGTGLIATITGISLTTGSKPVPGEPETSIERKFKTAGGLCLGLGITAIVGGIVMMAMGRTKVRVTN